MYNSIMITLITVIVIPPESSGLNMQITFFGKAHTCDDPHEHIIHMSVIYTTRIITF